MDLKPCFRPLALFWFIGILYEFWRIGGEVKMRDKERYRGREKQLIRQKKSCHYHFQLKGQVFYSHKKILQYSPNISWFLYILLPKVWLLFILPIVYLWIKLHHQLRPQRRLELYSDQWMPDQADLGCDTARFSDPKYTIEEHERLWKHVVNFIEPVSWSFPYFRGFGYVHINPTSLLLVWCCWDIIICFITLTTLWYTSSPQIKYTCQ